MQYKPLLLALMLGRRRVKTMGAVRMCRRIWLTPTSTSPAIIPKQPVQKKGTTISTVSDYFKNIRTRSVHPRLALGYDFGGWRVFSAPAVAAGLHQSLQYYRSRHCRRFRQIHQFRRITPIPQKP
ncbi:hypothetical protein AB9R03_10005 [Neisseria gonorrhoeae]